MFTLISGGSGSGKSELAESIITEESRGQRIYIATMQPFGLEAKERINKHRKMRQKKGFLTLEHPLHLQTIRIPEQSQVLLECLSNLCANEIFDPQGAKDQAAPQIIEGIEKLVRKAKNLVVVTNEVFQDGLLYDDLTRDYIKTLGYLNQQLAQRADRVIECIYGLPIIVKGEKNENL